MSKGNDSSGGFDAWQREWWSANVGEDLHLSNTTAQYAARRAWDSATAAAYAKGFEHGRAAAASGAGWVSVKDKPVPESYPSGWFLLTWRGNAWPAHPKLGPDGTGGGTPNEYAVTHWQLVRGATDAAGESWAKADAAADAGRAG